MESPDMIEVDGAYWLICSGNWFNQPSYAIGAARCLGPQGPCVDTASQPLLASNSQGLGPAEPSIYSDGSGTWMLDTPVLAAMFEPRRAVMVTRIGFRAGGPYLAAGGPPPPLDPFSEESVWTRS